MPAPSPDVGAIVHLEHVNLRVPDHRLATLYFVEGLGLTRDPFRRVGVRNMWVNVGTQQFHLPIGEPTTLPGEVGVVVADLDGVARRLQEVAPELRDTGFSLAWEGASLATTTPWGHRVRLWPGPHAESRLLQRVPYVEFWVAPGTSAGIGAFYREVLSCPVASHPVQGEPGILVTVGPGQSLRFRERAGGGTVPGTNHIAVYLGPYRRVYAALEQRGLVLEPDAREQFRFSRIVEPATGQTLFEFEHEVRSLHHPDFLRPLVNRVPVPHHLD